MTLDELIDIANGGYPDDLVQASHKDPEGQHGDGLARFIALELAETFDELSPRQDQLAEAIRVMTSAREELDQVIAALERAC